LRDTAGVRLVFPPDTGPDTLRSLAAGADVIVGWRPDEVMLQAAKRLKLFINPGAGVQHLLPRFSRQFRERGVVLVNGHGNACFTAQHAVALLLALTNHVVQHDRWMRQGRWRTGDTDAKSMPLCGRAVGLLGYGHVNRHVHLLLSRFDASFAVLRREWAGRNDPMPTPATRFGPAELRRFLEQVDVLVAALPETDDTRGLIGARELELLGPDGLVVNVGRGPVFDEEALYRALQQGTIRGAAIDVWYDYRPEPDTDGRRYPYRLPFHELDNVVLSPHRAASPLDDLARWDEVVENIRRFAAGRMDFLNTVDLDLGY
jgi:phosphoglycerate dehydrogenase-like enzyme